MPNYSTIEHFNSNNSRRRGLCGYVFNRKTGRRELKTCTTIQAYRDPEGEPAGRMHSREVIRAMRSRYVPHIGKKHAAKLKLRAAVA